MVDLVGVSKVKLRRISVLKTSYLFALFGLVLGIINSFLFFISIRTVMDGWEMTNIPVSGLAVLSFVIFPVSLCFVLWLLGLIYGWLFNLCLRLVRGLDMFYEEIN